MSTRCALPSRSATAALALTLLLPAAAVAQETTSESEWPTTDQLRQSLQQIGYAFEFDASNMAAAPEWVDSLPAVWTLVEPSVVDDAMPDGDAYDALTLRLIDVAGQPAQLLFGATSSDQADGELGAINSVLMEVAARLPEDAGIDAAVWFINNVWQSDAGREATALPCLVAEFDGGATVVWRGADGEGLESFFGTVAHVGGDWSEIEQCRSLQEQVVAGAAQDPAAGEPAAASSTGESSAPSVDFSVPPEEAVALIEAGEHTIVDVRTPEEFEQAHIVGAVNIPVESPDFAERIAELDPDEPYLLYCRTGRRSDLAAQQMAAAGFTDITDAAGLADLARAGAPVE